MPIEPDTKDWTWVLDRRCEECGFVHVGEELVGRRSDGSAFTVESLGRYWLHDVEHHLHDVRPS